MRQQASEAIARAFDISQPVSEGTDIEAAMAVAETGLANAPAQSERWLIIVSDLRQCTSTLCDLTAIRQVDLRGAHILVAGFGGAGDGDVTKVRDAFRYYFTAAGASDVRFLLPGQRLTDFVNSGANAAGNGE